MAENGFFSLGQIIAGGDPRPGEKAYLEGLNTGSRIRSRQASTESALAQARLRRNKAEAQDELKALSEEFGFETGDVTAGIAGVDPQKLVGAEAGRQDIGFRETISDIDIPFEQRQASAQAVEGKVVDPFQFGPGGELATDVFTPDIQTTATGQSQIDLDAARAEQARAAAALNTKKRTNPELFKSSTTFNLGVGDKGLGDQILDDIGESTIPTDIIPEAATGITGMGAAIANTVFDVVNVNLPFPDTDRAGNAMRDLMTRTQITGQQSIPGRPSNYLMQQLATFGVEPNSPFSGDQKSVNRMNQTSRFLGGEIDRLRRVLNGGRLTKSKLAEAEDAIRAIAALKQDYDVVISRFNADAGLQTTAGGGSFVIETQ